MGSTAALLGGGVVALVTATGAYLVAVRRLSGKIDTSEAASLWAESASIREDYRDRLRDSADRILRLEERVAKAEETANTLGRENLTLLRKASAYEGTIMELREQIEQCRAENEALRTTIRKVSGLAVDD